MTVERQDIVLLATASPRTNIVYNHLSGLYGAFPVIFEQRQPRKNLVKGRSRRLGWPRTLSQSAFSALIKPALAQLSEPRIRAIIAAEGLDPSPVPESRVHRVASANAGETVTLLQSLQPQVVVVAGTRLIKKSVLDSVPAYFFNIHMGLTPRYRGAHGAYWALWEGRPDLAGVTVHRLDPGVDTGPIVGQARVTPTRRDTLMTYPYLQVAAARALVARAIAAGLAGDCPSQAGVGPSAMWHNPTVGEYLRGLARGVK